MIKWILAFRIANSLIVRSYFSPDEYWQSLEVAHKIVFGYGELTWEWEKALRSVLHPMIFAIFYWILQVLNIDTPWLVAYGPRILQGCMLGVTDYFIYKTSGKIGLTISLSSWFLFYAGVRTYSNSVELMLNSIAFYYYQKGSTLNWSICVGASCMIRPTAVIIWIPYYIKETIDKKFAFFSKTFALVFFFVGLQVLIDSLYFKRLSFTSWNFFYFNFLSEGSQFYGRQPWHWVITEGLPVVHLTYFPYLLISLYKNYKTLPGISYLVALLVLSMSPHKEYRFLLSFFPIAVNLISKNPPKNWVLVVAPQVIIAIFLSLFHQVAPLETMDYLQEVRASNVGFFINCHGTPFYSHMHSEIPMRFLQCRPFERQETLEFFKDPSSYIADSIRNNYSHIVIWSSVYPKVADVLKNYTVAKEIFHSFWTESFVGYESNVYFYVLTNNVKS